MINNKSDGQQFWTTYSPGRRPWGRINTLCSRVVASPTQPGGNFQVGPIIYHLFKVWSEK